MPLPQAVDKGCRYHFQRRDSVGITVNFQEKKPLSRMVDAWILYISKNLIVSIAITPNRFIPLLNWTSKASQEWEANSSLGGNAYLTDFGIWQMLLHMSD